MTSKSQSQFQIPPLPNAPAPPPVRTLRRFQSHQNLSTKAQSLSNQTQHQPHRTYLNTREKSEHDASQNRVPTVTTPSHGRHRSNSDVASPTSLRTMSQKPRSSTRKSGSMGFPGRRSGLEILLRDGPPGNNLASGLDELRYLILSHRVDADGDGMVCLLFLCRRCTRA